MQRSFNFSFLNANIIKILAALFMVLDHVGYMLFPKIEILRILGRLSMPLFAFMIAEGATFTRNKFRYFLLIFLLGVIFQVVYFFVYESLYMGILITFSLSIIMIYTLQFFKSKMLGGKLFEKIYSFLLFALSIFTTYILNLLFKIDYGFWGCLLPLFATLLRFDYVDKNSGALKRVDNIPLNLISFAVGLILLCLSFGKNQYYSLLALPILFFYSGDKGKLNLKYFFYIFYPLHMVIIYAISLLF